MTLIAAFIPTVGNGGPVLHLSDTLVTVEEAGQHSSLLSDFIFWDQHRPLDRVRPVMHVRKTYIFEKKVCVSFAGSDLEYIANVVSNISIYVRSLSDVDLEIRLKNVIQEIDARDDTDCIISFLDEELSSAVKCVCSKRCKQTEICGVIIVVGGYGMPLVTNFNSIVPRELTIDIPLKWQMGSTIDAAIKILMRLILVQLFGNINDRYRSGGFLEITRASSLGFISCDMVLNIVAIKNISGSAYDAVFEKYIRVCNEFSPFPSVAFFIKPIEYLLTEEISNPLQAQPIMDIRHCGKESTRKSVSLSDLMRPFNFPELRLYVSDGKVLLTSSNKRLVDFSRQDEGAKLEDFFDTESLYEDLKGSRWVS